MFIITNILSLNGCRTSCLFAISHQISGKQGKMPEKILYLCALELPPAAVLASAILYLGKNQLEIEYEF